MGLKAFYNSQPSSARCGSGLKGNLVKDQEITSDLLLSCLIVTTIFIVYFNLVYFCNFLFSFLAQKFRELSAKHYENLETLV